MRIGSVYVDVNELAKPAAPKSADPICMKTAMKAYKDKKLTGITDEEWETIKEKIRAKMLKYLETTGASIDQMKLDKDFMDEIRAYIRKLLKEVGFKGDLDAVDGCMISQIFDALKKELGNKNTDVFALYQNEAALRPPL